MKFEREGCTFEVPDRPNVRQQLEYFSATAGAAGNQLLIRFWMGARELITNWECEALPDYMADIESLTNPSQAEILTWAGLQVKTFFNNLEDLPPNS